MEKSILIYSNGEKIGDGVIKLPLLHEIKKRFSKFKIIWIANGTTVYNNTMKNFVKEYIDEVIENVYLQPFFWQKISKNYDFSNKKYEYIFDTQKAVARTLALKRIKSSFFISASANGIFSSMKIKKNKNKYYLDQLLVILNQIKNDSIDKDFTINIPENLLKKLSEIFTKDNKYLGIAPGAGESNKIWPLNKFIKVGKYFEKNDFKIVFFLGPQEESIKEILRFNFPEAIYPEETITAFSNIEVSMASTKFLSCALANDSGISHILSTKYCPLIKLFGNKDPNKFTPLNKNLITICAKDFDSNKISKIPSNFVIKKINEKIY